jgi:hypothetical protein
MSLMNSGIVNPALIQALNPEMSCGTCCAETTESPVIGSTIKTVRAQTMIREAAVALLQQTDLIFLNKDQETIAMTAATEIAEANGQTTRKQPIAINEPNNKRTRMSTRSVSDGNCIKGAPQTANWII